jgi:hypothetical protein
MDLFDVQGIEINAPCARVFEFVRNPGLRLPSSGAGSAAGRARSFGDF